LTIEASSAGSVVAHFNEVIMATNPTVRETARAAHLESAGDCRKASRGCPRRITTGSVLEFANKEIWADGPDGEAGVLARVTAVAASWILGNLISNPRTLHAFSYGQELRLVQKQVLAPRMIQSMEILQLPIMALQERIEQEIQVNPVLDLAE
jgi:hypothetical protein